MVRTKVFVGNLSFSTKEADLATEFGSAGKVISANIITRGPRSLGYGFVEMESEEAAQNAVKLMDKKDFQGRQINVEVARPQEENKPREPRERKPVANSEGQTNNNARKPLRRRNYRKKGESTEGEQTSNGGQQKTETTTQTKPASGEGSDDGKTKRVKRPRKPRPPKTEGAEGAAPRRVPNENKEESQTTLFVANLPFVLDDDGFSKIVTDLGLKLKAAHVVKKRNNRSKGYGFVEFDTHEDQQKALAALNKKTVDGRELSVKVALTETKTESKEEEKKENKPASQSAPTKETKQPATKEAKNPPATKESKPATKESKPAAKETKPVAKETKQTEKKDSPKADKPAAKETKPAAAKEAKPAPKKEEKKDEKK